MSIVFFTGFPGFLGTELVPRILNRHGADVSATCLVQARFMATAQQRVAELTRADPALEGRINLVDGDITQPDLGLGEAAELKKGVMEIFHLAAIYDLAVPRHAALRVNVDGTGHMLDFAAACRGLKRFHYVSTCYVAGKYVGAFTELDLEKGQTFNNYYEETKYLAEVEVQRKMKAGMPITIYRPSIVVGDSATGATQKYDGPYFVIQWLLRQAQLAVMPLAGNPEFTRVNVVPRDFVVSAMAHLSGLDRSLGKVYQLCDPNPFTVEQMVDALGQATGRKIITVPTPLWLAKNAIAHGPGVYRFMKIPAEAVDYFTLPTFFTCNNALTDLEGSGIHCPQFSDYAVRLVGFMKEHPEVLASAMA